MQYLGQGNGADGALNIASNTTESSIDSSAVGTATTDAVVATNSQFAAGQMIMLHQSRGSGAGSWELNFVEAYSHGAPGSMTTEFPLVNTYGNTGADRAQVRKVPQYSSITIQSGFTYSAKAWDPSTSTGGILAAACNGDILVDGVISASAKGYLGGAAQSAPPNNQGAQGEGTAGAGSQTGTANGNGGGGVSDIHNQAGSGGENSGGATAGSAGSTSPGNTAGTADLITMVFGGGGGSGSNASGAGISGAGGRGGGIIALWFGSLTVSATGSIVSDGAQGSNTSGSDGSPGAGGGGAGGSIRLAGSYSSVGNGRVHANGALGGTVANTGGRGGEGRIAFFVCDRVAGNTTSPSAYEEIGGQDYCQSFIHICDQ